RTRGASPDTSSASDCLRRAPFSPTRPSTQTVTAIAEGLCFAEVSSFRRAFKREFGYTPGEVRHAAVSGLDVTPKARVPSAEAHFSDLLRGF
ncbi:MAG: helix-turn-helix domain-containing protein, partial [Alphaproteobacteria bacterium]|nr:helix-turn-helix domain-containing protein [Alphaproteobacteria bacterium]